MSKLEKRLSAIEQAQRQVSDKPAPVTRLFEKLDATHKRMRAGRSEEEIAEMEAEASAQAGVVVEQVRSLLRESMNHATT